MHCHLSRSLNIDHVAFNSIVNVILTFPFVLRIRSSH